VEREGGKGEGEEGGEGRRGRKAKEVRERNWWADGFSANRTKTYCPLYTSHVEGGSLTSLSPSLLSHPSLSPSLSPSSLPLVSSLPFSLPLSLLPPFREKQEGGRRDEGEGETRAEEGRDEREGRREGGETRGR
jgi:hypothetical protein